MLLNRSRGELGGKPFAQHCSCPAVLRCSVGSTVAAFRELLAYGRIASIAQGTSPALNRQGGNVLVAASYNDTFILHSGNAPTNVALVARPCAPAAQHSDESSNSRSRLAKSYGRFAPLSLKQDCFFRVPSSKIKNLSSRSTCGGQRDDLSPRSFIFQTPLRQLSKVCACFADA